MADRRIGMMAGRQIQDNVKSSGNIFDLFSMQASHQKVL